MSERFCCWPIFQTDIWCLTVLLKSDNGHVEEQRMGKDEVIFNIKVKEIKSDNETVNVDFILIIGNEEEARRL